MHSYTQHNYHFKTQLQVGIWRPSKNSKIYNIRSLLTQAVLSVSRHSICTTYDHRSHPQEPRTSIVTPNKIITFRVCCKWAFGVPQKILEYLMEGLHQPILIYLCPAISFQLHMSTGDTHRNLRQA